MLNRKKAGILSVVGLSVVILSGVATNALADTQSSLPKAHTTAATSQQIADSMAADMAKKLDLNAEAEKKVSSLFKIDGEKIRNMQMQLGENRHALNALSPKDKTYMKQVNKLAEKSADLTKQLTIQYAKSRAELYALLTPDQIKKLENYGKQAPKPPKES